MQEPICEILLEKLCTAVQKVQEQYAGGQEVIKDSESVNQLCQSVDEIFSHGLREGILNWASGSETTYWPLVTKVTYKEVLQNIYRIPYIKNDKEKCQVWIRMACRDNSLGSYLNIITQDQKLLADFYHPHAFVFDKEKVDTAKTALLYGLSHLDFNISLGVPRNSKEPLMEASVTIPVKSNTTAANGPSSSYNSSYTSSYSSSITKGNIGKKKKKVKSSIAVIADSFDDNTMMSVEKYLCNMSAPHDGESTSQTAEEHGRNLSDNVDVCVLYSKTSIKDLRYISNNDGFNSQSVLSTEYQDYRQNHSSVESEQVTSVECDQSRSYFSRKDSQGNAGYENQFSTSNFSQEYSNNFLISNNTEEVSKLFLTNSNLKTTGTDDQYSNSQNLETAQQDNLAQLDLSNRLCNQENELSENGSKCERINVSNLGNDIDNLGLENKEIYVELGKSGGINEQSHDNVRCFSTIHQDFSDIGNFNEISTKNHIILENEQDSENLSAESNNHLSEEKEITSDKQISLHRDDILDNDYDYQVSCARFEYGTPTEHSPFERNNHELDPEENEDLNFVPGIHKNDPWSGSRSSSFSSLTGPASFNPQSKTEEKRRSSTLDSKSFIGNNSPVTDTWKYVTNSLSSTERKDSRADDMSVATDDSFGDLVMFEELLGMNEDHFSSPESFMGLSNSEELHHAIVSCKEMIKTAQTSEEKKSLVRRLIQLRMKQQESKEESFVKIPDSRKILGHQFLKGVDTTALSNVLCDRCGKWIWTIWQSLFTCQYCQFHSHRRCLDMIRRQCASRKVSVSMYSLSIAPEHGLHAQQYKCVECRKMISLTKTGQGEARLCDYSGQYFCEDCHWNDHVVIPARVVHNWDYGTYKVSRQTKQFLDLMDKKPILNLEQINPALFRFVGELRDIKRFREEILIMKKYFMSCRMALESKLLLQLQDRQHFVDNSSNYSLQDLLEVEQGTMLPFITRVHSLFLIHIKSDCELCRAKGFVCEICQANEVIFAFDPHAVQCVKCRSVFHKLCYKKDACPKCARIQKRTPK